MTPLALLQAVAARLPGSTLDGRHLYIGEQLVAVAAPLCGKVFVTAAVVFDGHADRVVLDASDTTPRRHKDPIGRVLAAIDERQAARAASKPGPTPGPSREPEAADA